MTGNLHADLLPLAQHLDRVMSCDLRARPYLLPIHAAAVAVHCEPVTLAAGRMLEGAIHGKHLPIVLIVTGFASVVLGVGEQDGPPGAAYLGRALAALGALPVFITDEHQVELMRQTARGGGLNVIDLERARAAIAVKPSVSAVIGWPADRDAARLRAAALIDEVAPAAIIAIERPGANEHGLCHQLGGQELSLGSCSDTDGLWRVARSAGIPSIGIGDAGNELGMGAVRAAVQLELADRRCTSCGGHIAAVEPADVTVMAAVSNWGAYAVAGALAACVRRPDILAAPETVEAALKACALAGGRNGFNDYTDAGADGYPWQIECAVVAMVRALVGSLPTH